MLRRAGPGAANLQPVDFEAEGLLDGLEDENARAARLDLLRQLHEKGVPLEELRKAVEEERLPLLPAELVLEGEGPRYTREEVAEKSGVDDDTLNEVWALLGPQLEHIYTVHMREQLRHDVIYQAELASGQVMGTEEVAICFADLVGFT